MEFIERGLDLIIKPVEAQSYDGISQPSFGNLDVTDSEVSQAQVNLITDQTTVPVGDTFTVDVEIETGNFTINEYQLVIEFDTTQLSVVDADTDTSGTQVEVVDRLFEVQNNANNVTDGRILFNAATPSGNALQVNRTVVSITFQPQQQGNTVIRTIEGVNGTKLINQNGIAINSGLNDLTINVGENVVSSSSSTSSASSSNTSSASANSSTNSSTSVPSDPLPETGILDEMPGWAIVLIGSILVILGIRLSYVKSEKEPEFIR